MNGREKVETLPRLSQIASISAAYIWPCLLVLLFCAIPMEHKYDKCFRHYSMILIPPGLELPPWFDKKIYFYASDVIALLFFGWGLAKKGTRFLEKGGLFLAILFCCAFFSLFNSPLSVYSLPYIRLFQLLTPIALFLFLANGPLSKERLFSLASWSLCFASSVQAILGIIQYFSQKSLGLRMLAEAKLCGTIYVPGGRRWFFDRFLDPAPSDTVYRAMGTMPHPNVLGGFLVVGLLMTQHYFFSRLSSRKWLACLYVLQLFALGLTYSRSAIFGYLLATLVWLLWLAKPHFKALRSSLCLIALSGILVGTLLSEQYLVRGGVVNYTALAKGSDAVRIFYQDVALRMIKKHPLFGVGYGQFTYRSPAFLPSHIDPSQAISGTHNVYLMIASEMGLIALAAFLLWLFWLVRAVFKQPKDPMTGILFSCLIALLFIGCCDFYPILFQQGKLMFFGIAGLLAAFAPHQTLTPAHLTLWDHEC